MSRVCAGLPRLHHRVARALNRDLASELCSNVDVSNMIVFKLYAPLVLDHDHKVPDRVPNGTIERLDCPRRRDS